MKCRQIHLGCPLNLFPGAEWLPGDASSPSPERRAHRNLGVWLISGSGDLWTSKRGDGNKDGQLRKRRAVYDGGFLVGGATPTTWTAAVSTCARMEPSLRLAAPPNIHRRYVQLAAALSLNTIVKKFCKFSLSPSQCGEHFSWNNRLARRKMKLFLSWDKEEEN